MYSSTVPPHEMMITIALRFESGVVSSCQSLGRPGLAAFPPVSCLKLNRQKTAAFVEGDRLSGSIYLGHIDQDSSIY